MHLPTSTYQSAILLSPALNLTTKVLKATPVEALNSVLALVSVISFGVILLLVVLLLMCYFEKNHILLQQFGLLRTQHRESSYDLQQLQLSKPFELPMPQLNSTFEFFDLKTEENGYG